MQVYTIGRLKGSLVVSWIEGGKRRRFRLQASTLKEAEAEARDIVESQTHAGADIRVKDIWGKYMHDTNGRSIATSMGYTGRAVLPFFGELRPEQITVDDCRAYVALRRERGNQDGTIWTQLNHLRICLNWAVKRQLIHKSPYIERPAKPAPRERYLTRSEIDKLLSASAAPHIRLAIILMLTTGARIGALLELTWDRVDLERNFIKLRKECTAARKGRATPPINNLLREALVEAKKSAISEHVVEWGGQQVGSIKKGFAAAVRQAGLHKVTPHVLRHTAAVHMAEAGVTMDEIAQYLGHSDTRVTASTYARYSPGHLRRAADALEFDFAW